MSHSALNKRGIKMKKILLLSFIIIPGIAVNADPMLPPQMMTEIHSFQGQTVHDMNYIRQQRFKQEEYDEMKDLNEQKAKKNKELEEQEPAIKRIFGKKPAQQNVQFKEENGEIKIESSN